MIWLAAAVLGLNLLAHWAVLRHHERYRDRMERARKAWMIEQDREQTRWVADFQMDMSRRLRAEVEAHNARVVEQMREAQRTQDDEPWK